MLMSRSLHYMPRLDGLRAIAVTGVLVEHWIPLKAIGALSTGGAGVTLFFVLSGYLITRILTDYRDYSVTSAAASFYWRRLLRLSPPFYAAILVGVVFDVLLMRDHWWINALYLTNFEIGLSGAWTDGADHFWSLCVEEQFYLIWFFVIVVLPRGFIAPAICLALLTTLLFRSYVYVEHLPPLTTVLLPGNLASLAIGSLLAHANQAPRLRWFAQVALERTTLVVTAVIFLLVSLSLPFLRWPSALFYPYVASAFSVCLVATAAANRHRLFSWLALPPLVHIGRISYGIFVYHLFVPPLLGRIPATAWAVQASWKSFALCSVVTLVVSQLSWLLFERPILRFKDQVAPRPKAISLAA